MGKTVSLRGTDAKAFVEAKYGQAALPLGPTEKTAHELACESSEWFTPYAVVEAARKVLGKIDLDPASCDDANRVVGASAIYTQECSGLAPESIWFGRVFLNPPSPPGPWWKRLMASYLKGNVTRAIYVAYSIEQLQQVQHWTPDPKLHEFPICIPKKRLRFNQPTDQRELDGSVALVPGPQPTHASAIIGLGISAGDFDAAFSEIGVCR